MVATKEANVTQKPTCRVTRFPYIFAAARHIGVHRITLYRVLMNQLPDRGDYAARYRAFVASIQQETV